MVPITSDLAGYAAFWTRVVACLAVLLTLLMGANLWLLWRILVAIKGAK